MEITTALHYSGLVFVEINGISYDVNVVNGYATRAFNLPVGVYRVNLIFRGTEKYKSSSLSSEFEIHSKELIDPDLSISVGNITVGNAALVEISANPKYSNNVNVVLYSSFSKIYPVNVVNGYGNIAIENLSVGSYLILVYADAIGDFDASSAFSSCNVFEAGTVDPEISIELPGDIAEEENLINIIANSSFSSNGYVQYNDSQKLYPIDVIEGYGEIPIYDLSAGNHTATLTLHGNDIFKATNLTFEFELFSPALKDPDLSVSVSNVTVGEQVLIEIRANETINSIVSVEIFGFDVLNVVKIFGSYGEFIISGLDVGNYSARVFFEGNDEFGESRKVVDFEVRPNDLIDPNLSISVESISFGEKLLVEVTARNSFSGNLTLRGIDFEEVYILEIIDGYGNVTIDNLNTGSYIAFALSNHTDAFLQSAKWAAFEVYGPGNITVKHTDAGDAADIQAAIDAASPGDVVRLGNHNYTGVADVNITKSIRLVGSEGTSIASAGDGTPIFNVIPISKEGPENLTITGVDFKLANGDTVVKATADNDTDNPLSIVTPNISIRENTFELVNETTVPESIIILELDSERGVLSPTGEISIMANTIAAGIDPFEFKVTSIGSGDVVIAPQNISIERKATLILYEDMNTTAVSKEDGGKTGEYFIWRLTDADGNPIANTPMEIGFNGVVYTYEKDGIITDGDGYAKLQINLGYKGVYTFAICFLGNDKYNASFVVAKITVGTQKPSLTLPNKSYAASAKTKTLTATFKTAKGNPIADKWITFTLNGKTYKGKTNAQGVASVNVSLNSKGTYSFVAKFAGDSTYTAINKTAKLTIK